MHARPLAAEVDERKQQSSQPGDEQEVEPREPPRAVELAEHLAEQALH
jgi:hypothetical protein